MVPPSSLPLTLAKSGKTPPFKTERLLICEGPEERAFVREMARVRQLPDLDLVCVDDMGTGGGNGGFEAFLIAVLPHTGFIDIKHIAILADSDHDQTILFGQIRDQIIQANSNVDVKGRYGVPAAPFLKAAGTVAVTVLMQPAPQRTGCLETLLWDVVLRIHGNVAGCVDQLVACSGIISPPNPWSQSKLDKARIRAVIAMLHEGNPALALSWLWEKRPDLIPATATEFDAIHAHLQAI